MASLLPFVNSASLFSYQMYRVTFFNQFGSHIAIYSNVAVAVLVCVSMRQNTLRSICFSALINIAKNRDKNSLLDAELSCVSVQRYSS